MKRTMRVLAVCTFVLILATPLPCSSQEPIKIGFAYVFSGRLAHYGFGAKQGAEMAMDEINASGGVLGRKLVGVYVDTKLKPDVGVTEVTKLILEERVDVVMGIVSSAVADAVAPVANRYATPFIDTLAMTPFITGEKCNPFTFRVSMNGPQNLIGASILAADMPAKHWTTIGPDYLFGYQCWEYLQKYLGQRKPGVTFAPDAETAYAPVTTIDFKPYISKIMGTKADGILVSLYGGNLVDFVRQANDMGFFDGKRQVLLNLAYSADVMLGLGLDMPKGIWLGGLYWFQQNSSPANKKFVDDYTKRYRVFPDYNAHGGYAGVKTYAAALQKAGSTDRQQVAKALEGLELDLPIGRTLIRAGDHQAVADGAWGMTDEFDPKLRCRALKPLKIFPGAEITPPVDQTGCRMQR